MKGSPKWETDDNLRRLRQWVRYEPDTGDLIEIDGFGWDIRPVGYARARHGLSFKCLRRNWAVSRVAWALHHGRWPAGVVDHINGDPLDNRLCNLRDISQKMNMANRAQPARREALPLGVCRAGGRFCVAIRRVGGRVHLGTFDTVDEAAAVYRAAAEADRGDCAVHKRADVGPEVVPGRRPARAKRSRGLPVGVYVRRSGTFWVKHAVAGQAFEVNGLPTAEIAGAMVEAIASAVASRWLFPLPSAQQRQGRGPLGMSECPDMAGAASGVRSCNRKG